MVGDLSPPHCILLAIHHASSANTASLRSLTFSRQDALSPELVLRILLTYLPESVEPKTYTQYLNELASGSYQDSVQETTSVAVSTVTELKQEQARKQVKKVKLLQLSSPRYPANAPEDALTRFLYHRATRTDSETGMLDLVPQLVEPFLKHNNFIRVWYVGTVLPLLRLQFEYYPEKDGSVMSLSEFEKLEDKAGVELLLQKAAGGPKDTSRGASSEKSEAARDLRGLVGPWIYGDSERKRRKISRTPEGQEQPHHAAETRAEKSDGESWGYAYQWMVAHSRNGFPMVANAIAEWDGPSDVDFGGFAGSHSNDYLEDDAQRALESRYAQVAFASCYSVQSDDETTLRAAHRILNRLAELMDFDPPQELDTSLESLPRADKKVSLQDAPSSTADIAPEALMKPKHPLTTPGAPAYQLLQLLVHSIYKLSNMGHSMSIANAAKLHFFSSAEEQLAVLQKILRSLRKRGLRVDDGQRSQLLWLRNWDISSGAGDSTTGAGLLGKIGREGFEQEILKLLAETSNFDVAISLYLKEGGHLPREDVERVVLAKAMEAYDGASNGNKTRGGIKKANDIISSFRPHFQQSTRFRQATALIAATHSLSFYSLTLQHGVPFKPVSIRVSHDPVGLLDKVLEQNPGSYTKLDDLVEIGRNLVSAGLPSSQASSQPPENLEPPRQEASRRVTFMAIEAALREDDFETAYSYILTRLTPSGSTLQPVPSTPSTPGHTRATSTPNPTSASADDTSWRAAFLAGRYRPASASPPSLRRLEQRTELLSLALLLAPTAALTEILAAWRRCEEEMSALQRAQTAAEQDFDDRADKRASSALPGNFTLPGEGPPEMVLGQRRREMGRLAGSGKGGEEVPVSMFDLTRGAAMALGRNAFPLRGTGGGGERGESGSMEGSEEGMGAERARKRDYVASAVSGGLASGLGWMLGATPVDQQQQQQQQQQRDEVR